MDLRMFAVAATVLLAFAASVPAPVSGQAVATSCAASLVTSFTPCLGYITSSTNRGGSSPTADCCRSFAAVVSASTSCACLILTGNVPLGLPINRTLAITLPKACNSMSGPLQCKAPMAPELPAPTAEPTVATPPSSQSQGQTRPQVVPSSAWRASAGVFVMLAVAGAMLG